MPVLLGHAETFVQVAYIEETELCLNACSHERITTQLLTANAKDEERVELLLAVLAQTRQVGGRLRLAVEQVVEQRERHLLGSAAVRVDVKQVAEQLINASWR